ncbi:MAG: single-stranded DNA-binding protein [Candidatus Lokiarchaeota archaeon]|nr:single-stranded DNA-binding protein [Candidatus Lokiarchaeota archaeon]
MKVSELKPNSNATVRVKVCTEAIARKVQSKKGYPLTVGTCLVGDETGAIEFSVFGKDVSNIGKNVAKVIDIKDGWVKEWNGKLQLSLGKGGTWEVVDDKTLPTIAEIKQKYDATNKAAGEDEADE